MKDYSVLDNLGCRMLDLKPYLKKAYDEGYEQGLKDEEISLITRLTQKLGEGDSECQEIV